MTDDGEPLPVEGEFGDSRYDDGEAQTTAQRLSGRSLLISNAVVAFAVIGFASLAVAVAVTVRPTAAAEPVVGHQNAAPGKFMPLLPTQQQAPVPAPPADRRMPDTRAASFRTPTATFRRSWCLVGALRSRIARHSRPGAQPERADPGPDHRSVSRVGGHRIRPSGRRSDADDDRHPRRRRPRRRRRRPRRSTPSTPSTYTGRPRPRRRPHRRPRRRPLDAVDAVDPVDAVDASTPSTPSSAPPTSSKVPYTSSQAPQSSAAPPSTPHTSVAPPHVQTQQTVTPKPVTPKPVTPPPATPPHSGHH